MSLWSCMLSLKKEGEGHRILEEKYTSYKPYIAGGVLLIKGSVTELITRVITRFSYSAFIYRRLNAVLLLFFKTGFIKCFEYETHLCSKNLRRYKMLQHIQQPVPETGSIHRTIGSTMYVRSEE